MQFDACFHFHLCCIINLPRVYKDCRTFNSIEFDLDNGFAILCYPLILLFQCAWRANPSMPVIFDIIYLLSHLKTNAISSIKIIGCRKFVEFIANTKHANPLQTPNTRIWLINLSEYQCKRSKLFSVGIRFRLYGDARFSFVLHPHWNIYNFYINQFRKCKTLI